MTLCWLGCLLFVTMFNTNYEYNAGPSGRAVEGVGLRPLACCDRGFESSGFGWSRGLHTGLWYPRSRVRSRPKPSDFSCWKNPQHAVRYDTNDHWKSSTRTMKHKIRTNIKKKNPAEGMNVCLFCVVKCRSLRRADHSSRGVLPTVIRLCVWSRNLVVRGCRSPRWAADSEKIINNDIDNISRLDLFHIWK
jgi:hypothetical protein